jgi:hypothetical protein
MDNRRAIHKPVFRWFGVLIVLFMIQAACMNTGGLLSSPEPTADSAGTAQAMQMTSQADMDAKLSIEKTQFVMNLQGTEVALKQTQAALEVPTQAPPPTEEPEPTLEPITPTVEATPGEKDYSEQIKNAKVLLYEDTNELGIGQVIEETLKRMGMKYTSTLDYSGDFMANLDSGTKWDLIIVGAENHNAIQGEFWDVLLQQSYKKTAIIAEVWYMDILGGGKMRNFTNECGVSYYKNWDLAESIYWVNPDHPIFNEPNVVKPLLHYNRYWSSNAGDRVRVRSTGDAEIVGGLFKNDSKQDGLITVCMEGRTVFQTFCNHDFRQNEVMDLWENYITYTLTNHFKALEGE